MFAVQKPCSSMYMSFSSPHEGHLGDQRQSEDQGGECLSAGRPQRRYGTWTLSRAPCDSYGFLFRLKPVWLCTLASHCSVPLAPPDLCAQKPGAVPRYGAGRRELSWASAWVTCLAGRACVSSCMQWTLPTCKEMRFERCMCAPVDCYKVEMCVFEWYHSAAKPSLMVVTWAQRYLPIANRFDLSYYTTLLCKHLHHHLYYGHLA